MVSLLLELCCRVMIASKNTSMNTAAHDISSWLDLTIAQIANSDINVSMEALVQFEEVFKRHSEEPEVIKKIDQVFHYHHRT